ncbi:MAG: endonuclease/exonuclease/phosphatase family protein [Deltaproteobacteria bacterium]|nr:endonuclease/exonuclease/phosphatase family protein [Deltaproteobacteria bacterium]
MTHRTLLLVTLSVAACAHGGPPKDLGDLDLDRVPIADAPSLAHVADAVQPGAAETVADLFTMAPTFRAAPDPTALLTETQAANEARENEGVPLAVATFNVALLDANIFGVIPYSESPYLEERRPVLPDLVLGEGYYVLLLQEVWRKKDARRFEEAAERHGYLVHKGPRGRYNDGVLTLVRAELLAEGSGLTGGGASYRERDGMEYFPGPHIKRGYLWTRFEHAEIGPITLFNTHMQAWPDNWAMRMAEGRQLGLQIREVAAAEGGDAVVIFGGDLNGGSYYRDDTWTMPDGSEHGGWFANTLSYGVVMHYGDLQDLYVLGQPAERAADDVTFGKTVPAESERMATEPFGDPAWCEKTHGQVFTASDCTVLYFEQYAGEEYPARMDHLMVHDPAGRVWVEESDIIFTEPVTFGDLHPMPPSDHLGVAVWLRVAPAK